MRKTFVTIIKKIETHRCTCTHGAHKRKLSKAQNFAGLTDDLAHHACHRIAQDTWTRRHTILLSVATVGGCFFLAAASLGLVTAQEAAATNRRASLREISASPSLSGNSGPRLAEILQIDDFLARYPTVPPALCDDVLAWNALAQGYIAQRSSMSTSEVPLLVISDCIFINLIQFDSAFLQI